MDWCHTFTFSDGTEGWVAQRPPHFGGTSGSYEASSGRWINGCSFSHAATILDREVNLPAGSTITRLEWYGGVSGGSLTYFGYYLN